MKIEPKHRAGLQKPPAPHVPRVFKGLNERVHRDRKNGLPGFWKYTTLHSKMTGQIVTVKTFEYDPIVTNRS